MLVLLHELIVMHCSIKVKEEINIYSITNCHIVT